MPTVKPPTHVLRHVVCGDVVHRLCRCPRPARSRGADRWFAPGRASSQGVSHRTASARLGEKERRLAVRIIAHFARVRLVIAAHAKDAANWKHIVLSRHGQSRWRGGCENMSHMCCLAVCEVGRGGAKANFNMKALDQSKVRFTSRDTGVPEVFIQSEGILMTHFGKFDTNGIVAT